MRAHKEENELNLEKLIEIEWGILYDLKKILASQELSIAERIRAANALAFHANVLNRLLAQKGETTPLNDSTLGDFIRDVEPRISRRVRVDFRIWKRRLTLKR